MPTSTFSYTGNWQTFTVPAGVTSVSLVVIAGGSGVRPSGRVTGNLAVSGGQVLYIVAGGQGGIHSGANAGVGGWGGAASGGAAYSGAGAGPFNGGNGGGGYSCIRLGSTSGTILAVAGGAGGDSGDSGIGGYGGAATGGSSGKGTDGSGSVTVATGGTQTTGGTGGVNVASGSTFDGGNASSTALGISGTGGNTGGFYGHGGGGGGGGYHGGGGGNASSYTFSPGTGGAGGSNYTGTLTSAVTQQGLGTAGNGSVSITWVNPNNPPATPTNVIPTPGTATSQINTVPVSATVTDPDGNTVRALFRYTTDSTFTTYTDAYTGYVASGTTASRTLPVAGNTHYYMRVYAQDSNSVFSTSFASTDFWSNRSPNVPTSISPANNAATGAGPGADGILNLSATVTDADGGNVRALFRYSTDNNFQTYTDLYSGYVTSGSVCTASISDLPTNTTFYLLVYGQDAPGFFSNPSAQITFFTNRTPTATVVKPAVNAVLDSTIAQTFSWTFSDPDSDSQQAAELQYRPINTLTWTTVTATTTSSFTFSANTFTPNVTYEWQIRVADRPNGNTAQLWSAWSPLQQVTLSPPVVNMSGRGGLSIIATDIGSHTVSMSSAAGMTATPSLIEVTSVAMVATATLTPAPKQNINLSAQLIGTATLSVTSPVVTRQGPVNLAGTARLTTSGVDSIPASVNLIASSSLTTSIIQVPNDMRAVGSLVLVGQDFAASTIAFVGSGALIANPQMTINMVFSLAALGALDIEDTALTIQTLLTMAANGSVDLSTDLEHDSAALMSSRGSMSLTSLVSRILANPMSAAAHLVIAPFKRDIAGPHISALASLAITGRDSDIGILALGATGQLILVGGDVINAVVHIAAATGLSIAPNQQVVFEGPYLTVLLSNGNTLSFTANSYPSPRKVRNDPSNTNVGNVHG